MTEETRDRGGVGHDGHGGHAEASSELAMLDPGEIARAVGEWARENPHAALASAVAVGFLVGGGLTPRMLGALGLMAARHYFRRTVDEVLGAVIPEELAATLGKSRP